MAQGPILIFDKSSLESLNLDEAVLLDNFYLSNVTPLFFVECLADLEKRMKSRSTPEQLVGSLALRTPEAQFCANVQDGIADFRSLTYSLANEESAKQKAVADAMRRAIGRATAALDQSKQTLGPVRYVNLEVRNLVGATPIEMAYLPVEAETAEVTSNGGGIFSHAKRAAPPPPPPVQPGKLTVSATIQCVFGIQK